MDASAFPALPPIERAFPDRAPRARRRGGARFRRRWLLASGGQDRRAVFPRILGVEFNSPPVLLLAFRGAGVALETDANELPLVVLPAEQLVELVSGPAIRAIAVRDAHGFDFVIHGDILPLVLDCVNY